MPFAAATRSSAHEVGIERAHALRPCLKKGIALAFAAMTARESEGVTKKFAPRIMFRSASPSAAAPKTGGGAGVLMGEPALSSPIFAISSTACDKFGSAWPWCADVGPPKSGNGVALSKDEAGRPSSVQKTALAYGPCTPPIESYTSEKSGRETSRLIAAKSKHCLSTATWSSVGSKTSTRTRSPTAVTPSAARLTCGKAGHSLISLMLVVSA
mmetsp:Transcript_1104/g.3493  ORF Transcript_1104/g.3493 Transcript_1104/m.3493 type:complete len:213 (+) Transcript_1104:783-1421(+)